MNEKVSGFFSWLKRGMMLPQEEIPESLMTELTCPTPEARFTYKHKLLRAAFASLPQRDVNTKASPLNAFYSLFFFYPF
jgi:hypothetical protein